MPSTIEDCDGSEARSGVLVTGGAGYFGSLLVRHLRRQNDRVKIFDINHPVEAIDGVSFVQGDIRDPCAVRRAVQDVDRVFHNVAQVPLAKDAQLFASVNRRGTQILLDACADAEVRKIVYTSSSAIYGIPAHNPVTEDDVPIPMEAYGRAKLEGERLCWAAAEHGLDVTVIRPRTIMGHGRLGIFQILFEWVRRGHNVPVLGCGDNRYQFVHADDLAAACVLAARRSGATSYNCGAQAFGTMRQALEGLCDYAGTGAQVRSVPMGAAVAAMRVAGSLGLSPLGPYHALMYGRSMYFDTRKATAELGWTPRYSNAEMFRESYDWYLAHRESVLADRDDQGRSPHQMRLRQGVLRCLPYLL